MILIKVPFHLVQQRVSSERARSTQTLSDLNGTEPQSESLVTPVFTLLLHVKMADVKVCYTPSLY